MKLYFVFRTKYDRQIAYVRLWENCAKRCSENEIRTLATKNAIEAENRELRLLLQAAERKLARFERKRGDGGKFEGR